jgi:hypothetical protein
VTYPGGFPSPKWKKSQVPQYTSLTLEKNSFKIPPKKFRKGKGKKTKRIIKRIKENKKKPLKISIPFNTSDLPGNTSDLPCKYWPLTLEDVRATPPSPSTVPLYFNPLRPLLGGLHSPKI